MSALAEAAGVAIFLVGLAVSIALHEIGHLVPAKAFGVKVTQYMIGFGPTLFSRRRGETEYGLKAVPLGGYIRMIGMYVPAGAVVGGDAGRARRGRLAEMAEDARRLSAEEVGPGDEPRTFHRLAPGKRIVVMLGGPVMNLLLATVFLGTYLTAVGPPQVVPRVAAVSACVVPAGAARQTCTAADPPTPAATAGLRAGDTIVSVDGVPAGGEWMRVQRVIRRSAGKDVTIVIERDGSRQTLHATLARTQVARTTSDGTPVRDASGKLETVQAGFLGISPGEADVPQPLSAVPGFVASNAAATAGVFLDLPARMVAVAQAAFGHGARDPNGPIGIVGVGRLSGEVASSSLLSGFGERAGALLTILGSLNLALFVFNLVPLLPLDGGHIAGALWEGVRRVVARARRRPDPGPFDLARLLPVTYAVVAVLLCMEVLLVYADIVRPVTLG